MSEDNRRKTNMRSELPRSPRVPVAFTVELEGQTPDGEPFRVQAEAVKVSRGGGTLKADVNVNVGASVRLTPPFGRPIEAEVNGVWIDAEDGSKRIGIKLLESNGWFAE